MDSVHKTKLVALTKAVTSPSPGAIESIFIKLKIGYYNFDYSGPNKYLRTAWDVAYRLMYLVNDTWRIAGKYDAELESGTTKFRASIPKKVTVETLPVLDPFWDLEDIMTIMARAIKHASSFVADGKRR